MIATGVLEAMGKAEAPRLGQMSGDALASYKAARDFFFLEDTPHGPLLQSFQMATKNDDVTVEFLSPRALFWKLLLLKPFRDFMEKHFKLTVQTGKILRFLGMRIIQTDQGISVDQAEYIYDLVFKHYGREIENLKIAPTPSRYDAKYEKDMYESKPLSPQLLQEY